MIFADLLLLNNVLTLHVELLHAANSYEGVFATCFVHLPFVLLENYSVPTDQGKLEKVRKFVWPGNG